MSLSPVGNSMGVKNRGVAIAGSVVSRQASRNSSRDLPVSGQVIQSSLWALVLSAMVAVGASSCSKASGPNPPSSPHTRSANDIAKDFQVDLGPNQSLELVWVPGGTFRMGSPTSEKRRFPCESPVHDVTVDGFWMGKYEVTNGQYRCYKPDHSSGQYKGMSLDGDRQPVVDLSWDDARGFCEWASDEVQSKGIAFRLPTEAEWEYACRAMTTTVYYWGDSERDMAQYENIADLSVKTTYPGLEIDPKSDGYAVTAPVGSFKPNAFGLYDMLGNASECCSDWYGEDYYKTSPAISPPGPASGDARVLRGGSWGSTLRTCRAAYRGDLDPTPRHITNGLRVVCVSTAPIVVH